MNQVNLIGRLTKEVDLKFAEGSGMAIAKFSIAVNRPIKKDEVDFINCVAFGKRAETIAQYIQKGHQIGINGSIKTGSYEDKSGVKKYIFDIVVDNFTFINGGAAKSDNNQSKKIGFEDLGDMTLDSSGDIPF